MKSFGKRLFLLEFVFVMLFVMAACQKETAVPAQPKRVVALTSSYADVWLNAGGKDTLVGVPKDAVEERNLDVNADITLFPSIQKVSAEEVLELKPDLVITSADLKTHEEIAQLLEQNHVAVYRAKIENMEEYLKTLKDFTEMTGKTERYKEYGANVKESIDELMAKLPKERKDVSYLLLRGSSKLFTVQTGDTVATDILDEMGAKNVGAEAKLSKNVSIESILSLNPDYLFVVYQGDKDAFEAQFDKQYTSQPAWQEIRAVKDGHLQMLDKYLFHYKPNARWAESYQVLLQTLYPEIYGEK